jgi:hypothetical protein
MFTYLSNWGNNLSKFLDAECIFITTKCRSYPLLPLQHLDDPWDQKKEVAEASREP